MLQTFKDVCQVNRPAIDAALADQVEHLELLVDHTPADARAFFDKTYVTTGMGHLMNQALQRLGGRSSQAVFELRQAMGGGKTHSMLALGFLAANPELASTLPPEVTAGQTPTKAKVVVVSGRNIPRDKLLWGAIAEQLGKADDFALFWKSGPVAPNEQDWIRLIGNEPVLILVDELPFYLKSAVTQSVGGGTLGDVTSTAVANLLSAALKLPRLCIVIATLVGHYEGGNASLARIVSEITAEAGRQAKPVTPVELGSDDIYHILRKRLLDAPPPPAVVTSVAEAFSEVIAEAVSSKTLEKSAEQLSSEIETTYPFHPSFKAVLAIFKENEGFRQTRGLMTVAALMIRSALARPLNDVYLLGPQHLDLTDPDIRSQVNQIYNLDPAITQDIAGIGTEKAHAQIIDAKQGNDAAAQTSALILMSSLAEASDAVKGLSEPDILAFLVAPARPARDFKAALDQLIATSWYLHRRDNGAWYFSRNENLTKKIEKLAETAPQPKIEQQLAERLTAIFHPQRRAAYARILVQPRLEDIVTRQERVLIILSPDSNLPPETARMLFDGVVEKNNFAVVSGDGQSLTSTEEKIRQVYAIAKVIDQEGPNSPNRLDLEEKQAAAIKDAYQTIASTLNRIYWPGRDPSGEKLLHAALKLDNFRRTGGEAGFDGEKAVEEALTATGAAKLVLDVAADYERLVARAEDMLWGSDRRTRWADVETKATSSPRWLWLPRGGLEDLKRLAIGKGRWRDTGDGWVEKGPFPAEKTSVRVNVRSYDEQTGRATLEVAAVNAGPRPIIHCGVGASVSASSPILEASTFETGEARLSFLAIDPDGAHEVGQPSTWSNQLTLTYEPREAGTGWEVELTVRPKGNIRWNTDGRTPSQGDPYSGAISLDGGSEVKIYAYAECDGISVEKTFTVAARGSARKLDPDRAARIARRIRLDAKEKVFTVLPEARQARGVFAGVEVTVGAGAKNVMTMFGPDVALGAQAIETFITAARDALGDDQAEVELIWKSLDLPQARDIDAIFRAANEVLNPNDVEQSD